MLTIYLVSVAIVIGYSIFGYAKTIFSFRSMGLGIVAATIPLANTIIAAFVVVRFVSNAISRILHTTTTLVK